MNEINPQNSQMKDFCGLSVLSFDEEDSIKYLQNYQRLKFFNKFNIIPFFKQLKNMVLPYI
jgi:hypothetical protein